VRQIHIDRAIEQAAAWNNDYVVLFSRPNGDTDERLEFLEIYKDYHEMERGKYKWRHHRYHPFLTERVFDVNYWIDKG
jgi:hypothetical protein